MLEGACVLLRLINLFFTPLVGDFGFVHLQAKAEAWVRAFLGPADAGNLQGEATSEGERPGGDCEDPDAGGDGGDVDTEV